MRGTIDRVERQRERETRREKAVKSAGTLCSRRRSAFASFLFLQVAVQLVREKERDIGKVRETSWGTVAFFVLVSFLLLSGW